MNASAPAKLNLALIVGPRRRDGKHEVVTILQRLDLADRITVVPNEDGIDVIGFADDTLVSAALDALGAPHGWRAVIDKRIPVAAGLGGGSSDAAAALRLGNAQLERPHDDEKLRELASGLGTDVPFFLAEGPQLGTGDGSTLEPVELPQDYAVCLLLPRDEIKLSTAAVYAAFDERGGAEGFAERVSAFRDALSRVRVAADLAGLGGNDLATSEHVAELIARGAFHAGVSGAGPALYGLFRDRGAAESAALDLAGLGECRVANPAW